MNFHLVSNEVKKHIFEPISNISYKKDPSGALSMIPPNILMVQDVIKCYNYKIGSVVDIEIRKEYERLCENDVIKEEYKIVEKKGLTQALDFLNVFKIEWIRIVLSRIHGSSLWLDNGPIKITKRIIHRVTGYPTLD